MSIVIYSNILCGNKAKRGKNAYKTCNQKSHWIYVAYSFYEAVCVCVFIFVCVCARARVEIHVFGGILCEAYQRYEWLD